MPKARSKGYVKEKPMVFPKKKATTPAPGPEPVLAPLPPAPLPVTPSPIPVATSPAIGTPVQVMTRKNLALSFSQFLFSASVLSGDRYRGELTSYSIYNNQRLKSAISQVGGCHKYGGPLTLVESFSRRNGCWGHLPIPNC